MTYESLARGSLNLHIYWIRRAKDEGVEVNAIITLSLYGLTRPSIKKECI